MDKTSWVVIWRYFWKNKTICMHLCRLCMLIDVIVTESRYFEHNSKTTALFMLKFYRANDNTTEQLLCKFEHDPFCRFWEIVDLVIFCDPWNTAFYHLHTSHQWSWVLERWFSIIKFKIICWLNARWSYLQKFVT